MSRLEKKTCMFKGKPGRDGTFAAMQHYLRIFGQHPVDCRSLHYAWIECTSSQDIADPSL